MFVYLLDPGASTEYEFGVELRSVLGARALLVYCRRVIYLVLQVQFLAFLWFSYFAFLRVASFLGFLSQGLNGWAAAQIIFLFKTFPQTIIGALVH